MSLLFPAFLAGLVAWLGPWILHRFNREDPPETSFPSSQFLEPTRVPESRKRKLRHIDLFGLRTLFVLAVCLLFAQPSCTSDSLSSNSQRNTFVVIDRSASMQTGDRWPQAVEAAREVLRSGGSDSSNLTGASNAVQLFDLSSELRAHADLSNDAAQAVSALNQLQPSFEAAQYGRMMQQLDALAARESLPVDVVFVTDEQQSNFPVQRRLLRTQHIDSFEVVRVTNSESNLSVRASASTEDGVNVQISTDVLWSTAQSSQDSASQSDAQSIDATVFVSDENRELASKNVQLFANKTQRIAFESVILPGVNVQALSVRVAGDANDSLAIDSEIQVPVSKREPILVGMTAVDDAIPETPALFVNTALTTDRLARVVSLDNATGDAWSAAQHWVVFLKAPQGEPLVLPDNVTSYVESGGNALVVLQSQPGNLNDATESAGSPSDTGYVGSVNTAHPLGLGELNWRDISVYETHPLTVNLTDDVLIRSSDGTPYLIERLFNEGNTRRSGRVLVLNDSLNGISSDLPLQTAFVDWTAQVIRWFDATTAYPDRLDAGQSVLLPAGAQVISPDGQPLRELAGMSAAEAVVLREPGIHTVATRSGSHALSVTVPWVESNLTSVEADTAWQSGLVESDVAGDAGTVSTPNAVSETPILTDAAKLPWLSWLLPIMALSLLAENLVANRRLRIRRDGL